MIKILILFVIVLAVIVFLKFPVKPHNIEHNINEKKSYDLLYQHIPTLQLTSNISESNAVYISDTITFAEPDPIPDPRPHKTNFRCSSRTRVSAFEPNILPATYTDTTFIHPRVCTHTPEIKHEFPNWPVVSEKNCAKFLVGISPLQGLGHRGTAMHYAMDLALEFRMQFVIDEETLTNHGAHGAYPNVPSLMGLTSFITKSQLISHYGSKLTQYAVSTRDDFLDLYYTTLKNTCNYYVLVSVGEGSSCKTYLGKFYWCVLQSDGFADRVLKFMINPRKPEKIPLKKPSHVTVAWHVRCGDFTIELPDEFFARVYNLIQGSNATLVHKVFVQNCASQKIEKIIAIVSNAQAVITNHANQALQELSEADLLIYTGSSFPMVAHFSACNRQLIFQTTPKEGIDSQASILVKNGIRIEKNGLLYPEQTFWYEENKMASTVQQLIRELALYTNKSDSHMLKNFFSIKVLVVTLSENATDETVITCLKNAELLARFIPSWTIRIHYNISHNLPYCRLRAIENIAMIEMSESMIEPSQWQYTIFSEQLKDLKVVLFVDEIKLLQLSEIRELVQWGSPCQHKQLVYSNFSKTHGVVFF